MACLARSMFPVGLIVLAVGGAHAQDYPSQPIRMIGSWPGGSADLIMRLIEPTLRRSLGQPIVIDNRATILLGELGAKAPPDGSTIVVVGASFFPGPPPRDTS